MKPTIYCPALAFVAIAGCANGHRPGSMGALPPACSICEALTAGTAAGQGGDLASSSASGRASSRSRVD